MIKNSSQIVMIIKGFFFLHEIKEIKIYTFNMLNGS